MACIVSVSGRRRVGNAELAAEIESLTYELLDLENLYGSGVLAEAGINDLLDDAEAEMERRVEVHRAHPEACADPRDPAYDQWVALAREVRQRTDLVQLFEQFGHIVSYAGHNSGRHCSEFAGRCFACGGRDRLRVWDNGVKGPGYWCRQCGLSGDAITAYRNLTDASFFEAVRALAHQLGISTMSVDAHIKRPKTKGPVERPSFEIGVA